MIFVVKGGDFHQISKKINKHKSTPVVSPFRVCIRNCPAGR